NDGFTLTGELYIVGTPTIIRTNNGSTYGGTVNDGGAATPSRYSLTLNNHTTITGKIHTRANAIPLPTDIPTSVPAAAGTRTVHITRAEDVATIGNWQTLADLNVTAANLTIDVPPGNYRHFSLTAASRLNFTAGVYHFSDPLLISGGRGVQARSKGTLSVAKTFAIE